MKNFKFLLPYKSSLNYKNKTNEVTSLSIKYLKESDDFNVLILNGKELVFEESFKEVFVDFKSKNKDLSIEIKDGEKNKIKIKKK